MPSREQLQWAIMDGGRTLLPMVVKDVDLWDRPLLADMYKNLDDFDHDVVLMRDAELTPLGDKHG